MKIGYMKRTYWLDPLDKPALLVALMRQLAGDTHIAFEGDGEDIDAMNISAIPGAVEGLKPPFTHE